MNREQHTISIGDGREMPLCVNVWETNNVQHSAWVATAEIALQGQGWSFVRGRGDTRADAVASCLDGARDAWRDSVRP